LSHTDPDREPCPNAAASRSPRIIHSDGTIDEGRMVDAKDVSLAHLDGLDLSFFRIDGETRLQFGDVELLIITPLKLRIDGWEGWIDERVDLGPLLALWPDTLISATIGADGELRLVFRSGATITVPVDRSFESWHAKGPGKALVVCGPDASGRLAVWE
jgi:hypothetical protein